VHEHAAVNAADAPSRIESVLRAQEAAWNRGDLAAFMELGYWQSDDLSFFSGGEDSRGFDAMLARYRTNYEGPGKELGKLTFSKLEVSVLAPDVAMARGRWDLDYAEKKDVGGLFTLVLREQPEGWRIVHDHTSIDG
jgi:beta-aspartyl-peptidase (threonine type)